MCPCQGTRCRLVCWLDAGGALCKRTPLARQIFKIMQSFHQKLSLHPLFWPHNQNFLKIRTPLVKTLKFAPPFSKVYVRACDMMPSATVTREAECRQQACPVLPTYTRYPLCYRHSGPKQASKKPGYAQAQISNHRLNGPTARQRVKWLPAPGSVTPP